jgi:hypothetical protein
MTNPQGPKDQKHTGEDELYQILYDTKYPQPASSDTAAYKDWMSQHFEHYKLFVEMMDKTSERRNGANSFFITANGTVLAIFSTAIGLLSGEITQRNLLGFLVMDVVIVTTGIAICVIWYLLLQSYQQLNGAKFQAINRMASRLSSQPYSAEWAALGQNASKADELSVDLRTTRPKAKKYLKLTSVEAMTPVVFGMLYALAGIAMAHVFTSTASTMNSSPIPETVYVIGVTATPSPTLEVTADATVEATAEATPP